MCNLSPKKDELNKRQKYKLIVPIFLSQWPCWIFGTEFKPSFYLLLTLVTLSFQEGLVASYLFLENYYFMLQLYTHCTHLCKMWKPNVYILKNVHILYRMWKECVYTEYETNTVLHFLGELGRKSLSLSLTHKQE